jgi:hypothetical protein
VSDTATARRVLVIRGSEWLRGLAAEHESALLLPNVGRYCCLGLDARARGVPDSALADAAYPIEIDRVAPREYVTAWCERGRTNERAMEAALINDNCHTTDDEKIAALRPIFAEVGIDLDWRPDE